MANAGEQIGRVRITTGATALGPTDNPVEGADVVVLDDFIYAEPQAIPEPASLVLAGLGGLMFIGHTTRRRRSVPGRAPQ